MAEIQERIKLAEQLINQLEEAEGNEKSIVKILNNLIETIEPISEANPNFINLRAAANELIEYHKRSAFRAPESSEQSENKRRSLRAVIEFFNCFKIDINYQEDYGPSKLITATKE